jgi:hypothetical protein
LKNFGYDLNRSRVFAASGKCVRSLAYSRPLRYRLRALLIKGRSLKRA